MNIKFKHFSLSFNRSWHSVFNLHKVLEMLRLTGSISIIWAVLTPVCLMEAQNSVRHVKFDCILHYFFYNNYTNSPSFVHTLLQTDQQKNHEGKHFLLICPQWIYANFFSTVPELKFCIVLCMNYSVILSSTEWHKLPVPFVLFTLIEIKKAAILPTE